MDPLLMTEQQKRSYNQAVAFVYTVLNNPALDPVKAGLGVTNGFILQPGQEPTQWTYPILELADLPPAPAGYEWIEMLNVPQTNSVWTLRKMAPAPGAAPAVAPPAPLAPPPSAFIVIEPPPPPAAAQYPAGIVTEQQKRSYNQAVGFVKRVLDDPTFDPSRVEGGAGVSNGEVPRPGLAPEFTYPILLLEDLPAPPADYEWIDVLNVPGDNHLWTLRRTKGVVMPTTEPTPKEKAYAEAVKLIKQGGEGFLYNGSEGVITGNRVRRPILAGGDLPAAVGVFIWREESKVSLVRPLPVSRITSWYTAPTTASDKVKWDTLQANGPVMIDAWRRDGFGYPPLPPPERMLSDAQASWLASGHTGIVPIDVLGAGSSSWAAAIAHFLQNLKVTDYYWVLTAEPVRASVIIESAQPSLSPVATVRAALFVEGKVVANANLPTDPPSAAQDWFGGVAVKNTVAGDRFELFFAGQGGGLRVRVGVDIDPSEIFVVPPDIEARVRALPREHVLLFVALYKANPALAASAELTTLLVLPTVTGAEVSDAIVDNILKEFVLGEVIVGFVEGVKIYDALPSLLVYFPQLELREKSRVDPYYGPITLGVKDASREGTITAMLLLQKHVAVKYAELNYLSPPIGVYTLIVEGQTVTQAQTLEEISAFAEAAFTAGTIKVGDLMEVMFNEESMGLNLAGSGGPIPVPAAQEAQVRAMTREQRAALVAEAEAAAKGGGFPWWILGIPVVVFAAK